MNQQYNKEIDLIRLGIEILKKWRFVLCMILAFGILIGGGKAAAGFLRLQDAEYMKTQTETVHEANKKYSDTKSLYEAQLENITKEIKVKEAYRESSIYLNLDPYNVYKETATYYVSTDYQIMPDMSFQNINPMSAILYAYKVCIDDVSIYRNVIAEHHYPVDAASVRELVTVTTDPENGLFIISAMGQDEEMAKAIMNGIREQIIRNQEKIVAAIHEHSIEETARVGGYTVDMTLMSVLSNHNDSISKLQEVQAKKQKELNELETPSGSVLTRGSVMKGAARHGILGCLLGGVLACGWICFRYAAKDTIPDGETLRRIYNVRVLGTYRERKPGGAFSIIDRAIEKLENSGPVEYDVDQAYAVAGANIIASTKRGMNVFLAGSVSAQQMHLAYEKMVRSLNDNTCVLIQGGDILHDPAAIRTLPQIDAVVFVEDMVRTNGIAFAKEVDAVRMADKRILGLIEVYPS